MNMTRRRGIGLALAGLACGRPALAQPGPGRTIRIVVPFAAGGPTDTGARVVAEQMQRALGVSVLVENRPGGNAFVGAAAVANAPADGTTLFFNAVAAQTRAFFRDQPFDFLRDFTPVAPVYGVAYGLFVNADLPVRTLREFIDYARTRPGRLNYAQAAATLLLSMELLKRREGLDIVGVPYRGSAPAAIAMLAGDIHASFDVVSTYRQQVEAGKVRALLFTGSRRDPTLPDTPTAVEAGAPYLQLGLTGGLWARAGTPPEVIARLNEAATRATTDPEAAARLRRIGWEPLHGPPETLRAAVEREMAAWAAAAEAAGHEPA